MTEIVAAKTEQPSPARLRDGFIQLVDNLLTSLVEVFPECDDTAEAVRLFGVLVKGSPKNEDRFISACNVVLKENSAGIAARDPAALFRAAKSMEVLKDIDLEDKWNDPDFSDKSKDHFWMHIVALETFSDLYCSIPSGVLGRIEQMASSLGSSIVDGTIDISNVSVMKMSNELLESISPEDLQSFQSNVGNVFSAVGKVATMISQRNGGEALDVENLMERLAQMQESKGDIDFSAMVHEIGGSIAPNMGPHLSGAISAMMKTVGDGNGGVDMDKAQEMLRQLQSGNMSAMPPDVMRLAANAALEMPPPPVPQLERQTTVESRNGAKRRKRRG